MNDIPLTSNDTKELGVCCGKKSTAELTPLGYPNTVTFFVFNAIESDPELQAQVYELCLYPNCDTPSRLKNLFETKALKVDYSDLGIVTTMLLYASCRIAYDHLVARFSALSNEEVTRGGAL